MNVKMYALRRADGLWYSHAYDLVGTPDSSVFIDDEDCAYSEAEDLLKAHGRKFEVVELEVTIPAQSPATRD